MSELVHLHPVVFTLRDVVTGCGFIAGIIVTGKAVMEQEDGKWWMYGVCPGGLAGSGPTLNEAFIDFRNRYREALFDIAEDCKGFLQFQAAVKDFYSEDKEEGNRWDDALATLRKSEQCVAEPFKGMLRKKPHEYDLGIQIDRLDNLSKAELKPTTNIPDVLAKAA